MPDVICMNVEINPSVLTYEHLPIFRLRENKLEFMWVCTKHNKKLYYVWARKAAPLNASRQFQNSLKELNEDILNESFGVVLKHFYGESAEFKNLKFQTFSERRECMIKSEYSAIKSDMLNTTICCLWSGLITLFRSKTNIYLNYNTKDFIPAFNNLDGLPGLDIESKIAEICDKQRCEITIAGTPINVYLIEQYILDKSLNGNMDTSEKSRIYSINLTDAKRILFYNKDIESVLYDARRLAPAMTLFMIREVIQDLGIFNEEFYPVSVTKNNQFLKYTFTASSTSKISLDTLLLLSGSLDNGVMQPPSLPVAELPLSAAKAAFESELKKTFIGGEVNEH